MSIFSEIVEWCEERGLYYIIKNEYGCPKRVILETYSPNRINLLKRIFYYNDKSKNITKAWRKFTEQWEKDNDQTS